jgi:hypothetical protein
MIKQFENYTPTYFSDAFRMDTVQDALDKLKEGDEYELEEMEENPDSDMLLDPHDGYEKQTYIQIVGKKLIYWEGWSSYCWKSLYDKSEYKGLSKSEAITKVIKERLIPSIESMGLKYINSKYWMEESWTDGVDDGYIMKVVFEL